MPTAKLTLFSNAGENSPNHYHLHSSYNKLCFAIGSVDFYVWQVKRFILDKFFRKYVNILQPEHLYVVADDYHIEKYVQEGQKNVIITFDAAGALDDDTPLSSRKQAHFCVFLDLQSDEATFGRFPNGDKFSLVSTCIDKLTRSILSEFSEEERAQRVYLAACYRLFEAWGWTDTIYGHLTARCEKGKNRFLINPFGLLYEEMTASSLVSVDVDGNTMHGGIVPWMGINRAGYVIHSAVHEVRHDINAVFHIHFADCAAISCLEEGIALISYTSHILGKIAYHEYEGIAISQDERKRLQDDLGSEAKVLVLRNHGVATLGETIGEAFLRMYILVEACKIQVRAQSSALKSLENKPRPYTSPIHAPREETIELTKNIAYGFTKEGFGYKELAAYMRRLDLQDPSYRL